MTKVTYSADFPGSTSEEALADAQKAADTLPFVSTWEEIGLEKFWDSSLAKSHKDDLEALAEFREREWTWIATLKATGHTTSP